jgi:hypothetical protein
MPEETADRCQATVASGDAVRAPRFETGQERENCLDIEIVKGERGDAPAATIGKETKQQPQRVAISPQRMRA